MPRCGTVSTSEGTQDDWEQDTLIADEEIDRYLEGIHYETCVFLVS